MELLIPDQTEDRRLIAQLMFNLIVPRPIAWISTVSPEGVVNIAPFSFYNGITSKPPLIMVSVGRRKDGSRKDTSRNILQTGEFVVNLVTEEFLKPMVESGKDFPPEVSEIEVLNLQTEPSKLVKPPRVKGVKAAFECKLYRLIEIGETPMDLIIGQIVAFHYDPKLLETSKEIVGRLGGKRYTVVDNEIELF